MGGRGLRLGVLAVRIGDAGAPESGQVDGVARLVDSSAAALGDTPGIRDLVRTIVHSALDDPVPVTLHGPGREAYERLDAALGPGADDEGAPARDDRAPFDPEAVYQACLVDELASFGGTSFGGVLARLGVLTF